MDTRIWDQVGLELVEINIEGTIETKGCGDGGDNFPMLAIKISRVKVIDIP
jgi:hypothetical protein